MLSSYGKNTLSCSSSVKGYFMDARTVDADLILPYLTGKSVLRYIIKLYI